MKQPTAIKQKRSENKTIQNPKWEPFHFVAWLVSVVKF